MPARSYRRYLLALLAAIYAFNYLDYQAIGLLLESIKAAFKVTDTDLGLLTGFAFTLFYSTFGIPIARWADRGNRARIIALTLGLRSIMVMLSGAAQTFNQLLLVRIGVAVGEAGCMPPALSLIADYFSPAERPRAVAIYLVGLPVSVLIGYLAGGWFNVVFGWRMTFVLLGAPGLVLVVISWLMLAEPRLHGESATLQAGQTVARRAPPVRDVVRALWGNTTFRHLLAMLCVNYFFGAATQWVPVFFIRSFGLSTVKLGIWLALMFGVGGAVGTYYGGHLASRYAPDNEALQLRLVAALNIIYGMISAASFLSGRPYVSLALTGVAYLGVSAQSGPLFATLQTVVPENMLATATAIVMLMANLIGGGLGPIAVGALSDALLHTFGTDSLRYALLATCPGYLWGAWHLWRAARTVGSDIFMASKQTEVSGKTAQAYKLTNQQ